jgi:hypothetical protein
LAASGAKLPLTGMSILAMGSTGIRVGCLFFRLGLLMSLSAQ